MPFEDDLDEEIEQDIDLDDTIQGSIFKYPRLKIAILCTVFTLIAWLVPDFTEKYLVFTLQRFVDGNYWTIITSQFIHANVLHLFGNLIFLWVFGGVVRKYGGVDDRFVFLSFLIGGSVGLFVSGYAYGGNLAVIGASAGVFTLAALAMLAHATGWSWVLMMPVGLGAFLYLLYNIAVSFVSPAGQSTGVAYFGHIAGFGAGMVEGVVWMPNWQRNLKVTLLMFGVLVVGLFVLGFVYVTYVGGMALI